MYVFVNNNAQLLLVLNLIERRNNSEIMYLITIIDDGGNLLETYKRN